MACKRFGSSILLASTSLNRTFAVAGGWSGASEGASCAISRLGSPAGRNAGPGSGTGSLTGVLDAPAADRKATRPEVVAHAKSLRHHAAQLVVSPLRISDDGTLVRPCNSTSAKVGSAVGETS